MQTNDYKQPSEHMHVNILQRYRTQLLLYMIEKSIKYILMLLLLLMLIDISLIAL